MANNSWACSANFAPRDLREVGVFAPKDYDMTAMMNEIVDIVLRAHVPTVDA